MECVSEEECFASFTRKGDNVPQETDGNVPIM